MAVLQTAKKALNLLFVKLCPGCSMRPPESGSMLCAWCLARVYPVQAVAGETRPAAFLHLGVMRDMMIRLKYSGEKHLGPVLAEMAAGEWDELPAPGETVTVVPSSRRTLRKRGYNQVSHIARHLCALTGARYTQLLSRNPGPSQVGLSALERRRNLSGVFKPVLHVPKGRIWLLDDVMATGETLAQARLALEGGGASDVVPLAVNFRDTGVGSMIGHREGMGFSTREDSRDTQAPF